MRTIRYTLLCLIAAIAVVCLSGCKSTQKVATVAAGEAKAHFDFFESIREQSFRFETLNARMNVEVKMPGKELSSRAELKMVRDSAFVLSVQPIMGIEVIRLEMDRDSIRFIDRMNKRYLAENYAQMKGQTPIVFNYNNLQSLFVNHLFFPGEESLTPALYNRFLLNQEGSSAEIKATDKSGLYYTFKADGEEKLLSTFITNREETMALEWLYSAFVLTEGQPFPTVMDVKLLDKGETKGGLKIQFTRIQTDIPVQVAGSIPDKYQRITLADLIKALQKNNE
ncbi:hypothetical protein M2137_002537 [Parabacteroides sp. PFB2-10]|uniref:DUF4292 domain-containing protein n=1 Tax=Parabacteroides sp. PFB2-10 TaxID=1742405 RepID=UPI0024738C7E|nr:DUF4292 domain-containing protein [Parabacteroides sp. PFB2-10]MDH6313747.1 hypothetical protein [Parabacteroides sp. PFB2-10]MDL2245965.1 DUF4292 domain-containing protein [Parabacteroides sp. OttesenSCG-928-J18]